MRQDLFRKLQALSMNFYAENEAGNLMSRITSDTDTIQQVFGFALLSVISGALLIVWIVIKMLQANVPYALLSLAVVPFMVVATVYFSGQARKAFRKSRQEMGNVNADCRRASPGCAKCRRSTARTRTSRISAASTPPTATPMCAPPPSPAR